jgi:hypothetical protein
MTSNEPLTSQDIIGLREEVHKLATALNHVATTEELDVERSQRRRTVGVFVFAVGILILLFIILFSFRVSDAKRISDNNLRILEIKTVCTTFADKHNGLVQNDILTLQVALAEHQAIDPNAAALIQHQIDSYKGLIVDPLTCTP